MNTTNNTTNKQILNKLHKIMSEVPVIEKDKTNTFHGYSYASEAIIKQTIQPLLVKHGILFHLEVGSVQRTGTIEHLNCIYHFTDIESAETLSGSFIGSGEDKGDKATYKAITGAIKYILTSTFLIPTGDDPENENGQLKKLPVKTQEKQEEVIPFEDGENVKNEKPLSYPKKDDSLCRICGAGLVRSKSTGSLYCSAKCWLKK